MLTNFSGWSSRHRKRYAQIISTLSDQYKETHRSHIFPFSNIEITAQLLLHGIEKVIVVARDEIKFKSAYDEWRVRKGIELTQDDSRVTFVKCDLGDIEDVYAAAKKIKEQMEYIHILICNAGMCIPPILVHTYLPSIH
jgi:hypothetical protein